MLRARIAVPVLAAASLAFGAELPPHPPLRVLIVSDEVNPHGLSDAELTQPGDLSAALTAPGSGLSFAPAPDAVVEIPTNSIEQATALLSVPRADPAAYDVLIYFAHRIPNNGNDAAGRQQAFVDAVEGFLTGGGGLISFHHGAYLSAGKQAILELVGATATGGVPWDTVTGQNVINTAPTHFVTCFGVEYPGSVVYADAARGVPSARYPFFNNTPDERYPSFDYNAGIAAEVTTLFGSDYPGNGGTHLLGWIRRRADWSGIVVGYQPGEYQPHALDDLDGNNFQILANAILFAAGKLAPDGIVLDAAPGPGPDDVSLAWHGCDGVDYRVYRSTDPATIADPANLLGVSASGAWVDPAPPGDVLYYRVEE